MKKATTTTTTTSNVVALFVCWTRFMGRFGCFITRNVNNWIMKHKKNDQKSDFGDQKRTLFFSSPPPLIAHWNKFARKGAWLFRFGLGFSFTRFSTVSTLSRARKWKKIINTESIFSVGPNKNDCWALLLVSFSLNFWNFLPSTRINTSITKTIVTWQTWDEWTTVFVAAERSDDAGASRRGAPLAAAELRRPRVAAAAALALLHVRQSALRFQSQLWRRPRHRSRSVHFG